MCMHAHRVDNHHNFNQPEPSAILPRSVLAVSDISCLTLTVTVDRANNAGTEARHSFITNSDFWAEIWWWWIFLHMPRF